MLKQKFRLFRIFSLTAQCSAQQPKWQNSCSKMWSIEQLYIELGSKACATRILVMGSVRQLFPLILTVSIKKIPLANGKGNPGYFNWQ